VQLRLTTGCTSEDYVKQKVWRSATLERCPNHPNGGCSFARHTSYERVEPPGAFIARYYCPESHTSFSLLPDFLAARLSSTLAEVELVATKAESATRSSESVAQQLRPDIGQQGAVRWVRRRVMAAAIALTVLKGLRPDVLAGVQPTIEDFRAALGVEHVLPALRELAGEQLTSVPHPVGLGPRPPRDESGRGRRQQEAGADPPR
jgi:hypothetical protein